nr:Flp family type IVb pilin [Bradyrhizobium shewense]
MSPRAAAIEYGLIAAGVSLAIITVVKGLGTKVNTKIHFDPQLSHMIKGRLSRLPFFSTTCA